MGRFDKAEVGDRVTALEIGAGTITEIVEREVTYPIKVTFDRTDYYNKPIEVAYTKEGRQVVLWDIVFLSYLGPNGEALATREEYVEAWKAENARQWEENEIQSAFDASTLDISTAQVGDNERNKTMRNDTPSQVIINFKHIDNAHQVTNAFQKMFRIAGEGGDISLIVDHNGTKKEIGYVGHDLRIVGEVQHIIDHRGPISIKEAKVGDELMTTAWGKCPVSGKNSSAIYIDAGSATIGIRFNGTLIDIDELAPPIVLGWWKDGKVHRERPEEEVELLPCPFCGGTATMGNDISGKDSVVHFAVWCSEFECKAMPKMSLWHISPEDAAAAWNTRAQQPKN